jgi:hypothetical protein
MNDTADMVDVDTAGRYVGGYQHLSSPAGEGGEGPIPLGLGAAPVKGNCFDAGRHQLFGDPIGGVLGVAEHDGRTMRGDVASGQSQPVSRRVSTQWCDVDRDWCSSASTVTRTGLC